MRWLLCLLFFFPLFADEDSFLDESLPGIEFDPSACIYNSINVTTGNYFEVHSDIYINSPIPIPIHRTHLSSDLEHHPGLFRFQEERIRTQIGRRGFMHRIWWQEPSGGAIYFKPSQKCGYYHGDKKKWKASVIVPPGYANTSGGEISGKTHLKNTKLTFKRKEGYLFELVKGNGEKRIYRLQGKKANWFWVKLDQNRKPVSEEFALSEVIAPNGNRLFYSYDGIGRLTKIEAMGPKEDRVIGWAHFSYPHKDSWNVTSIETSDGQFANYRFDARRGVSKPKRHDLLVGVSINGLPEESYVYDNHRITQRVRPLGELLSIHYLRNEGSALRNRNSDCFRVCHQTASVEEGSGEALIARFSYNFGNPEQYGWTDVYDAYDNLTRYHYDVDKRLNLIEKFQNEGGSQTLTGHECFFWQGGALTKHCHTDASHQVLYCRELEYDQRGNIITESYLGNLSGEFSEASKCYPFYSQHQRQKKKNWKKIWKGIAHPQEVESYKKIYSYSDDGFNNLLSEINGGKEVVYTYLPNTDLIASKSTYIDGAFFELEEFAYGPLGQLIFHKRFDGYRTLCTEISLCQDLLGLGLPEIIEEYALDKGKKVPIKTEYIRYSEGQRIIQRDIVDGQGMGRYSLYYDYDKAGRLISETNPLGQKTTYTYDQSGNLICTETPTRTTLTTYDRAARPVKTEISDQFGLTLTRTVRYDLKGNPISKKDDSSNETLTEYDREGRPIRICYPPVLQKGCWVYPETRCSYDAVGNLISEVDEGGFVTLHAYNNRGQKIETQYPDGTKERWVYTFEGLLSCYINQIGLSTRYVRDPKDRPLVTSIYDSQDRLLKETRHTYEGDCLRETIHPDGTKTTFTYNAIGQLIIEDREGAITAYEYDPFGRQSKKIEGDQVTCWDYDLLDQKIREEVCDTEGNILTWRAFDYDFDGNQTLRSEGGAETCTTFGLLGPVTVRDPLGYETSTSYSVDHPLEGFTVRQTLTVDPLGNQTVNTFDPRGNLHSVAKRDVRGNLLAETTFSYDLANHKVEERHLPLSGGMASTPYQVISSYDLMGRLLSLTEKGKDHSRTITYAYDNCGRLATTLKPSGITLTRTYDSLGRLKTLSGPDFADTYAYDLMDHLIEVTGLDGSQTLRVYDRRGFLISETLANGHTIHFKRTLQGKISALQLPDGSSISYTYQGSRIKTLTRGSYTFHYSYDAQGRVTHFQSPVEDLSTYRDPMGRPLTIESSSFSQQLTYDPAGNLLTLSGNDPVGHTFHSFTYDDLYQIASEDGFDLSCDSLGNRLSDTCDSLNQLIESSGTTLTYDPDGCPLTQGSLSYTYDSQGRLIAIESDSLKATFTYDPFHRRLTKTLHKWTWIGWRDSSMSYLYAAEDEIGAIVDQEMVEFRPLGPGLGAEVGVAPLIELHGHTYFPLYDFRGSVCLLLNNDDVSQEVIRYSAFGESEIYNSWGSRSSTSSLYNPYQFLSKRTDEESGLVFFGRRYYQPSFGRWLTPDPKGYEEGPHLYRYCNNRPLTQLDLRGLATKTMHDKVYSAYKSVYPHFFSPYLSRDNYKSAISFKSNHDQFYSNKTGTYSLNRQPFPHGGKVMFINGVNTKLDEARSNAEYLSEVIGGYDITYTYNPTGGILADLSRAASEIYNGIATAVVEQIHQEWDAFFDSAPSWMNYLVYAHSEGTAILRNALMSYDEKLRNRVIPISIAPSAYIWTDINVHSWHYRSTHDCVPLIDLVGLMRCKENTTVLPRAEGASLWDHSWTSDTYREPIESRASSWSFDLVLRSRE